MVKTPQKSSQKPKMDRARAFVQLFQKKAMRSVSRWLKRLGVPRRDRKDVIQDVFLAAHRSFPTYNPLLSRPERWLNRITVHVAAHYSDRMRRRREHLLPGNFERRVDETPAPDELLKNEQSRLMALELLQRLDVNLREVLIAHDLDEIPMTQIARQHKIPVSTAYKWRARAILASQEILAQRKRDQQGKDIQMQTSESRSPRKGRNLSTTA
jgi:RNA polymerase sigma-70 factor, ECF subfamily